MWILSVSLVCFQERLTTQWKGSQSNRLTSQASSARNPLAVVGENLPFPFSVTSDTDVVKWLCGGCKVMLPYPRSSHSS